MSNALIRARAADVRARSRVDGVPVFAASFLEEAFGGLVREHHMTKAFLDERLRIRTDAPILADFVSLAERYIERADQAATG